MNGKHEHVYSWRALIRPNRHLYNTPNIIEMDGQHETCLVFCDLTFDSLKFDFRHTCVIKTVPWYDLVSIVPTNTAHGPYIL